MAAEPGHAAIVAVIEERMAQTARQVKRLHADLRDLARQMGALAERLNAFLLEDARRVGFARGMKVGVQAALVGIGAVMGGGLAKLLDWFGGAR